jgi:hypothetical protein
MRIQRCNVGLIFPACCWGEYSRHYLRESGNIIDGKNNKQIRKCNAERFKYENETHSKRLVIAVYCRSI